MGLFNRRKKSEAAENAAQTEQALPFTNLTEMDQLDEIIQKSETKLVGIFKHSTRCGTSRMAWNMFQRNYNKRLENTEVYFLDLLAFREISNEIALRFGVVHQSPQLILIKNGTVVHHSSHHQITPGLMEAYV